eukprot:2587869-Prymnesium_polylepis.1
MSSTPPCQLGELPSAPYDQPHPAGSSANQPISQSANQPISQSANQPHDQPNHTAKPCIACIVHASHTHVSWATARVHPHGRLATCSLPARPSPRLWVWTPGPGCVRVVAGSSRTKRTASSCFSRNRKTL